MGVSFKVWDAYYKRHYVASSLPTELQKLWDKCRYHGLNYPERYKLISCLSPGQLKERMKTLNFILTKLREVVQECIPCFGGRIMFIDQDCNCLYSNEEKSKGGWPHLGSRLSLEYIGNNAANTAVALNKGVFVCNYEHINPLYHNEVSYAEPVYNNRELVGAISVHMEAEENATTREAVCTITKLLIEIISQRGVKISNKSSFVNAKFPAKYTFDNIIHQSAIMSRLISLAKQISSSESPILILGESGTGKELLASSIHCESLRSNGPFIPVDCASLSVTLLESELFGYGEGAFTGASKGGKKGKLELAHGGTLFLDEVGELSYTAQAKFLRVLQEKEFIKIGEDKLTKVNIRIICATNKELKELCLQNRFRWDLYYRLTGMCLIIPPLRERKEDILLLAKHYISKENNVKLTKEAQGALLDHDWPGNIREIKQIMEAALLLSEEGLITGSIIKNLIGINKIVYNTEDLKTNKKKDLYRVLDEAKGNISLTAKIMGVSRITIYRWLKG